MAPERAEQVSPAFAEALQNALVLAPRALQLARQLVKAVLAQPGDVFGVRASTDLVYEGLEALAYARCFQLVAQDRCQRQRQRRALVEQVEQRQVAAGDRLP